MPRLKLEPLYNYPFAFEITVRTTDLNYGGHLGNDKLISLIHEARVAFLAHHGFTETDFGGVPLILGDIAAVYLAEAFAGDVLRFEVAAGEPTRCGFRLFFHVTRPADNKTIALVENGMVCFNYQTHSIQPLPKTIKHIFALSEKEWYK